MDPADLIERLSQADLGGDYSLRAGNVYLLATPEEEAALKQHLEERFLLVTRRMAWRVSFGTLPGDHNLPTGILANADAGAIAAKLVDRRSVDVSGLDGQIVHAAIAHQQALVTDVEVVHKRLDPTTEVLQTGCGAQVQATSGYGFVVLDYLFQWVDPLGETNAELRTPVAASEGELTTTVKAAEAGKGDGQVSATLAGASSNPGQRMHVALPTVWNWSPRGQVFLPNGMGLVLSAGHPQGRAVLVVEVMP